MTYLVKKRLNSIVHDIPFDGAAIKMRNMDENGHSVARASGGGVRVISLWILQICKKKSFVHFEYYNNSN